MTLEDEIKTNKKVLERRVARGEFFEFNVFFAFCDAKSAKKLSELKRSKKKLDE